MNLPFELEPFTKRSMDKQIQELVSAAKALGVAEDNRDRLLDHIKSDKDKVSHNKLKLVQLRDQLRQRAGKDVESLRLTTYMPAG